MSQHSNAVARGDRFAFGENWARFLTVLDGDRIAQAEDSLRTMLGVESLAGKRFLDVGSGSGLFSLAARRMGATVHSFDYDPQSVACTKELRQRYFPDDDDWRVEENSILDTDYVASLGEFDVVYSWGVLHHTGAMWTALENVIPLVSKGGALFIAIYNDQGGMSRRWQLIKRTYNRLPWPLNGVFAASILGPRSAKSLVLATLKGKPQLYFDYIKNYSYRSLRGMSYWHDLVDWIGGYPFEVATPEAIFDFYQERGFQLQRLTTSAGGIACNQYVFRRTESD